MAFDFADDADDDADVAVGGDTLTLASALGHCVIGCFLNMSLIILFIPFKATIFLHLPS